MKEIDVYKEFPQLFRGFVFVDGVLGTVAVHLLVKALNADPQRLTIQKSLLGLTVLTCYARCIAYSSLLDFAMPFWAQHLLNALVYWCVFSLHSVLLYFMQEFSRINWSKTRGFTFLYSFDFLDRFKPMLIYSNLLTFVYTYLSLCMIHLQPGWAFIPMLVGSTMHAVIYTTFSVNFWNISKVIPPSSLPTPNPVLGQVWWIPCLASLCMLAQAGLTMFPLVALPVYADHFVAFHSSFFAAEVLPLALLLYFLREKPAKYFVAIAAAA